MKYTGGKPVLDARLLRPGAGCRYSRTRPSPASRPILGQCDKIDFDWSGKGPAPGVGATNFSIRWTGRIRPETTGKYMFSAGADDGVRVFLDANRIINDWSDHAFKTTTAVRRA